MQLIKNQSFSAALVLDTYVMISTNEPDQAICSELSLIQVNCTNQTVILSVGEGGGATFTFLLLFTWKEDT